jgi:hypothetical protein
MNDLQPIDKKELKMLIEEGKKEGKDTSELEQMLKEEIFTEATIGEVKTEEVEREVKTMTKKGPEKVKKKGRVVILSTGPAREEDFE